VNEAVAHSLHKETVNNRAVDPDSVTLWICIRIRIGNPDPGSGSRARKLRNFRGKLNFLVTILKKKNLPLKRYKIALTTF
jgi:hypothetical protein